MSATEPFAPDVVPEVSQGAVPDIERLLRILREPADPKSMTDGSSGYHGFHPARIDSDIWRLGWTDGRIGSEARHVEGLCQSRAAEIHSRIAFHYEERRAEAKAKRETLEKQEKELSSEASSLSESRQLGARQQVTVPFMSSRLFGYLLLLMAAVLCLCDLPLSWNMGAYGFGLPKEVCVGQAGEDGLPQLRAGTLKSPCKAGQELSHGIEALVSRDGVEYLRILWPTFLLTLVLVAAALSAKAWLDITHSKPGQSPWKAWTPLGLFVITAFCLAEFRYQVENRISEPVASAPMTLALPEAGVATESDIEPTGDRKTAEMQAEERELELRAVREQVLPHLGIVLLPIVLPLFAGFAMSSGLSILQFPNARRDLDEQLAGIAERLAKVREALAKQSAIENASNDELARLRQDLGLDRIGQLCRSVYEHGYERGRIVESSLDAHPTSLYQACLHKMLRSRGREEK